MGITHLNKITQQPELDLNTIYFRFNFKSCFRQIQQ